MIIKGIDTLEFGLDIDEYYENFNSFLQTFEVLKKEAQSNNTETEIDINGTSFKLHRSGIPFYAYKLSCNDFIIYFMDSNSSSNPPVKVRFLSNYLWAFGFENSFNEFMKWFECFELIVIGNRISRIDICMDSDEFKFVESDLKGVVTKAKGKSLHYVNESYYNGKHFSGFTIGRGNPLLARIYNKTIEIKKSQKYWFIEIWKEAGWQYQNDIWRVEFQLRREILKEFQINRVEDFYVKESGIWAYLTQKWLTIKQPRSENVTRWKLKRKWELVQKAKFDYLPSPLIRKEILLGNSQHLLNQVSGIMFTLSALLDHESLDDTTKVLRNYADLKLMDKKTTFNEQKEIRQNRYFKPIERNDNHEEYIR